MLSENIKAIRKSKGLSQQELAVKLNVVRRFFRKTYTRSPPGQLVFERPPFLSFTFLQIFYGSMVWIL